LHFRLLKIRAKIKKEDIVFFSWLIESYEEIGIMITIDPAEGIVEFWISPFFKKDFLDIISSVNESINFMDKDFVNA